MVSSRYVELTEQLEAFRLNRYDVSAPIPAGKSFPAGKGISFSKLLKKETKPPITLSDDLQFLKEAFFVEVSKSERCSVYGFKDATDRQYILQGVTGWIKMASGPPVH